MSSWQKHNQPKRRDFIHNLKSNQIIQHHTPSIQTNITNENVEIQYNYVKDKKVCIIGHLGVGDYINMIPIIDYFCGICSEVKVICLENTLNSIKSLYKNPKLSYLIHNKFNKENKFPFDLTDYKLFPLDEELYREELRDYIKIKYGLNRYYDELSNRLIYTDNDNYNHREPPFNFYYQLKFPFNWFWKDFKFVIDNDYLMSIIKEKNIKDFIFIHNSSSDGIISSINKEWLLDKFNINDDYLIINPNTNMYEKSSKYYELAEKFLNKPIIDYINIISNASYLFLTNSSFFCLSLKLNLKSLNNFVFKRNSSINYLWDKQYGFNKDKPLFKEIDISSQKSIEEAKLSVQNNKISYIAGGRLGDFILQLSVIKMNYIKTGKKGILYLADIGDKFIRGLDIAYNDTKEIVLKQDYISDYKIYNGEKCEINLSSWRNIVFSNELNWINLFRTTFNVDVGILKWIENIPIKPELQGKILISHSIQRDNDNINLTELLSKYDTSSLHFICLDDEEYKNFINKTDLNIPYTICDDLMELFVSINSCELFIGNFSAPLCVALSLHKKCIGLAPTNPKHSIDLTLIKDMPKYWRHFNVIY